MSLRSLPPQFAPGGLEYLAVKTLSLALSIFLTVASAAETSVGEEALRLRNLSLAELENEQPAKAEIALQQLVDAALAADVTQVDEAFLQRINDERNQS